MTPNKDWSKLVVERPVKGHMSVRKQVLLRNLERFAEMDDLEKAHYEADLALLNYINDPQIRAAFLKIKRRYA